MSPTPAKTPSFRHFFFKDCAAKNFATRTRGQAIHNLRWQFQAAGVSFWSQNFTAPVPVGSMALALKSAGMSLRDSTRHHPQRHRIKHVGVEAFLPFALVD